MSKATKTAAELEAMIFSKMRTLSECPPGMTVTVQRRGEIWEALTVSPVRFAQAASARLSSGHPHVLQRSEGQERARLSGARLVSRAR
jgi:hypothetical protein